MINIATFDMNEISTKKSKRKPRGKIFGGRWWASDMEYLFFQYLEHCLEFDLSLGKKDKVECH